MSMREEIAVWTNLTEPRVRVSRGARAHTHGCRRLCRSPPKLDPCSSFQCFSSHNPAPSSQCSRFHPRPCLPCYRQALWPLAPLAAAVWDPSDPHPTDPLARPQPQPKDLWPQETFRALYGPGPAPMGPP